MGFIESLLNNSCIVAILTIVIPLISLLLLPFKIKELLEKVKNFFSKKIEYPKAFNGQNNILAKDIVDIKKKSCIAVLIRKGKVKVKITSLNSSDWVFSLSKIMKWRWEIFDHENFSQEFYADGVGEHYLEIIFNEQGKIKVEIFENDSITPSYSKELDILE